MNEVTVAQAIPPNTSAWWPLDSQYEGRARTMYPTMEAKMHVLAHVETNTPVFFSLTNVNPDMYISRRLPPLKSWPVSLVLFDCFTVSMKLDGRVYLVISNTSPVTANAKGRVRVASDEVPEAIRFASG